jgi:hypothetical protein
MTEASQGRTSRKEVQEGSPGRSLYLGLVNTIVFRERQCLPVDEKGDMKEVKEGRK